MDYQDKPTRQIIRLPEVMARTGMKKSFLYKAIAEGSFVRGVKLGRATGWDAAAIDKWIADRLAGHPLNASGGDE